MTADNTPTSGEKTHGNGTGLGLGIRTQRVTDMIGATGGMDGPKAMAIKPIPPETR